MPKFFTPQGQVARYEQMLLPYFKCTKCASQLRPIAFVRDQDNSAFLFDCVGCHEPTPRVFAKKELSPSDVIINMVRNVEDLNRQIQQEASQGTCLKCGLDKYKSIDAVKSNRMALDIVQCGNCKFSIPIISIVNRTLFAYSYDIQLAKKVSKTYPEISFVFCVSALETYFRQLFEYHSEANAALVKRRRVNFQNLTEARTLLKREFSIDIMELIKDKWQFLHKSFKWRHGIIHNASFDIKGNRIQVSEVNASKLLSLVDDLVYKTEMYLFNNNVII